MKPHLYELEIELHEAAFFASHELHDLYFTEPLIGNYALAYAFGLVKSPYDRYHVGYAEDLPKLNQEGIYITPAWHRSKPRYRIERFNCQAESFTAAMGNNAVIEVAGRQYLGKKGNFFCDMASGTEFRPTNRPQTGVIKLLSSLNLFTCHALSNNEMEFPRYIRIGKFMSKAKVKSHQIELSRKESVQTEYQLINPLDLNPDSQILFGDTINIHPTPLIRKAEIKGQWWIDRQGTPRIPADMEFRGF